MTKKKRTDRTEVDRLFAIGEGMQGITTCATTLAAPGPLRTSIVYAHELSPEQIRWIDEAERDAAALVIALRGRR